MDAVTASEALGTALAARVGRLCAIVRDARQPPLHRRLAAQRLGELVGRLLALAARSGFGEILETKTIDRSSND